MSEYAPSAIRNVYNIVKKHVGSARLSGIVGDRAHTYGYHRCRAVLPSGDYSVQLAADRKGSKWAASALDISLSTSDMKKVTKRLIASAQDPNDPRMIPVREFYGTTNGNSVNGRIHSGNYVWKFASSDSSHLWHIHIGFLRQYADNKKALEGVASVIIGESAEDELSAKDVWKTDNTLDTKAMGYSSDYVKSNPGWTAATGLEIAVRDSRAARAASEDAVKEVKAVHKELAELKALLKGMSTGSVDADAVVDEMSKRLKD